MLRTQLRGALRRTGRRWLAAGAIATLAVGLTLWVELPASASSTVYQAESAALAGGTVVATDHAGYTGSGFVGGYTDANKGNARTTFTVSASPAGSYTLALRYANGTTAAKTLSLYLNGAKVKQVSLPATANWDTWATATETVTLAAGSSTVAYRFDSTDSGNANVDSLTVSSVPAPPAGTYEAESAALSGGTAIAADHSGYTGAGFVGGYVDANKGNAATTFTVSVSSTGAKTATLRYANGNGVAMTLSVYVNGSKVKQTALPATANWDTWGTVAETLTLNNGSNTIAYRFDTTDTGNVNLDNVAVSGATAPPPPPNGQYEAESATLAGGAAVATDHSGYTGTGFVGGYTDANRGNANTTFSVSVTYGGAATSLLRYANGSGANQTLSIYVNGARIQQLPLPTTATWDTWSTASATLNLNAGANSVAYRFDTTDTGNVNLDNIVLTGAPSPTPTTSPPPPPPGNTYEEETGFLSGGPTVATATAGYTGTGYATGFTAAGARAIRTVNVASAGSYTVTTRYANGSGSAKALSLYLNGTKSSQVSFPATSGWSTVTATLSLRSSVNLISYQYDSGDSGNISLDNVVVGNGLAMASTGATMPYTEYLAAAGSTNANLVAANRTYGTVAAEAVGRQYVQLNSTGHYVQWTTTAPTNSIDIRFNIPDSADGAGISAPIALYANGTKVQDITLTSKTSWTYGGYPYTNNPGDGSPHHFFDEVHALIGNWPAGTVLKLQKDSSSSAAYYNINLIDTEQVDAAFPMPAGYLTVTSYGATANDGSNDTSAFNSAISAAQSQGKGLWIPSGTFNITSRLNVANVTLRGAGQWYTVLQGAVGLGGLYATGNNVTVADLTIDNAANYRNDGGFNAALEGNFGTGSLIFNVWMEHTKVGMWPDSGTNGLYVAAVRVRDQWADGVNLHANVQNTRVDTSVFRNTGDDAMAMFSDGTAVTNCAFTNNTIQSPMLANGIGIYGGNNNKATGNSVSDIVVNGSGITVSTYFGIPFSGPILISGNSLDRAGSYHKDWATNIGAIWIFADIYDITNAVTVSNNTIANSSYQAILLSYNHQISNLVLDHDTITNPGTYGIDIYSVTGSLTASYVTVTGARSGGLNNPGGYTINRGAGNSGW